MRLNLIQFSERPEEWHDQGKKFTLAEQLLGKSKAIVSNSYPMNPRKDSLHPFHLTFHIDSEARKDFSPLCTVPHESGILATRLSF